MSPTRRDFIRTTAATAAALAAGGTFDVRVHAQARSAPGPDPAALDIADALTAEEAEKAFRTGMAIAERIAMMRMTTSRPNFPGQTF